MKNYFKTLLSYPVVTHTKQIINTFLW